MKKLLTLFFVGLCLQITAQAQETASGYHYFSDGRAVVWRDGHYGFIDRSGREVIPCRYDRAYSFNDGIAMVRQGLSVFAIDTTGKQLDVRVRIPQFLHHDFSTFVWWVRQNLPFASTDELKRLGRVTVNALVTIGADGTVTRFEPLTATDSTAVAKVRETVTTAPKWTPAKVNDTPVEVTYLLPIEFSKIRPLDCYTVDAQGRRLHGDFVYPRFREMPASAFQHWIFTGKGMYYKKRADYYAATSGTTVAAFTIDEKGKLCDIEILSTHNEICARQLLQALQKSPSWQPATVDGKPVAVRYEYPFRFKYRDR